jgi:hypothetical protein
MAEFHASLLAPMPAVRIGTDSGVLLVFKPLALLAVVLFPQSIVSSTKKRKCFLTIPTGANAWGCV